MIIERQNVLDLIGKNKHKYSSCIITCYTFDFTFFEERVIPTLRISNIRNINVFLDGKHLEQTLEKVTGSEFKTHKTYSLIPVYEIGIFHPKIMLLTGVKHGLLIIGSGNLTSSGLSTNDEIWAAFHLNSLDSMNAPIFAEVWRYLQFYFEQAKGFNRQKISWISQYSPWVNELGNLFPASFTKIDKQQETRFIANKPANCIYQELRRWLPEKRIKKLSIISPYFDEKGKLLEQIITDYEIGEVVCITDSQFGLLPTRSSDTLVEKVKFYDWKDCLENFDKRFNRLHAKVFHFEYENGWEYLLLGSPNATTQAFGTDTSPAKNGEAALLLKRNIESSYLSELGIDTRKATLLDIRSYDRVSANRGDSIVAAKWKNRIVHSERNGPRLSVHLQKQTDSELQLQVLNEYQEEVEKHSIEAGSKEINFELLFPNDAFRIVLLQNENRASNFSLIHNLAYQTKCNPDPNQAELSQIIENLSNDPDNDLYIELLKHTNYNWVDEELDERGHQLSGGTSKGASKSEANKLYDELSEEKFNQLSSVQSIEVELTNNPNIQIADFLRLISKGLISKDNDIQESEEEALAGENLDLQSGHGKEVAQVPNDRVRGGKEQKAIQRHITNVYSFYKSELIGLLEKKTLRDTPNRPLKLKDLSNMSIMLDLLYIFYGKEYTIHKTEFGILFNKKHVNQIMDMEKRFKLVRLKKTDPDNFNVVFYEIESGLFPSFKNEVQALDKTLLIQQEEYSPTPHKIPYIIEGVYNAKDGNGLKADLIEVLGSFLLCASAGFNCYDYELYNEKTLSYRQDIFEAATFLILNVSWKEDEEIYRDILLLDLLNFIYPKPIQETDAIAVTKTLQQFYDRAIHKGSKFFQNLRYYTHQLLPSFICWKQTFEHDRQKLIIEVSSIHLGSLVYSSRIGFAALRQAGADFLVLKKPGLIWDDSMEELLIKVPYPQSKIITYKQKSIHTPVTQEAIEDTAR